MMKRWIAARRRILPLLSAGLLFQVSGCTLDLNSLVAGVSTQVLSNFVQGVVFGAFNVVP
ncbi:MAG: hypothetical protein HY763_10140 [Planctomycetes bacterium]|nr:hypothetical protein [Planctomycetota bacterium]